ncbi:gamma subclass chorismate mutase AroQ [Actinophytocola sp.]|uniref:gamma subclass chorismate mutase AroQ n=1 Tax=Actinophytocola sp. TaxID=1872138 RepID=UPI002ED92C9E
MAQQHDVPAPSRNRVDSPRATSGLGPLTGLAIARLLVSDQVAASKFGTGQPIDDPAREQQELDQVRQQAVVLGIDPTATVRFFQDQIAASKIVQRGLFRLWTAHPDLAPTTRPDLGTIRQELDQLTTQILRQLQSTQDIRHRTPLCGVRLLEAQWSGEITNHLDAVHRHALDVALRSVCSPR